MPLLTSCYLDMPVITSTTQHWAILLRPQGLTPAELKVLLQHAELDRLSYNVTAPYLNLTKWNCNALCRSAKDGMDETYLNFPQFAVALQG